MELVPMKEENTFALEGLSFTDLKIIKEACNLASGQRAGHIAEEIDRLMGNVSI
jgi:hypothetical protein